MPCRKPDYALDCCGAAISGSDRAGSLRLVSAIDLFRPAVRDRRLRFPITSARAGSAGANGASTARPFQPQQRRARPTHLRRQAHAAQLAIAGPATPAGFHALVGIDERSAAAIADRASLRRSSRGKGPDSSRPDRASHQRSNAAECSQQGRLDECSCRICARFSSSWRSTMAEHDGVLVLEIAVHQAGAHLRRCRRCWPCWRRGSRAR